MIEIFKNRRRGAGNTDPDPAPRPPEPETDAEKVYHQALMMIGAAQGMGLIAKSNQIYTVLAVQLIKDHKAYKALGYNWETFCLEVLGRPRTSVDEEIRNLAAFGQEFMEAAERISLGRHAMRVLRRLPEGARPRVLPSGELEVGDQRVPLDAAHKDQIEDLLEQVVDGQKRLEERIEKGEAQLAEKDDELAARVKELEERDQEIEELKRRLDMDRAQEKFSTPALTALLRALMTMSEALRVVEEEEEDPELVLKVARKIAPVQSKLMQYGSGWVPYEGPNPLEALGDDPEEGEEAVER